MKPAILLMEGKGLISRLIRWQTRSEFTHAAFLLPDGRILESWQGAGVRICGYPPGPGITAFDVPMATDDTWRRALEFAHAQVGKSYDYVAIARFLSRRDVGENDAWFCSELVFAAMRAAGIDLLARVEPWEVSPGLLAKSPLLVARG